MTDSTESHPLISNKEVFVTYAWDEENPDHQSYVEGFVNLLRQTGIHADMDLRQSQQETAIDFSRMMHQGINDYRKVIVFMSKAYQEKASAFKDGVGKEYQFIIKDIDRNPSKYILVSTLGRGYEVVPLAFRNREIVSLSYPIKQTEFDIVRAKILDLQTRQFVEVSETLEMIAVTKPNILLVENDTAADHNMMLSVSTTQEVSVQFRTSRLLQQVDEVIENKPLMINALMSEFFKAFLHELQFITVDFDGASTSDEISERVYKAVEKSTPLRNQLITFLDKITVSTIDFNVTKLVNFLEKLLLLHEGNQHSDHYTFINHELFILIVSTLLKNESYEKLSDLFYTTYHYTSRYGKVEKSFVDFRHHAGNVDDYVKKQNGGGLYTGTGKAIVSRTPAELTAQEVINADLLCYYISELKDASQNGRWIPVTFIYTDGSYTEFYDKLKIIRVFDQTKVLFDVEIPRQLARKLLDIQDRSGDHYGYHLLSSGVSIPPIYTIIDSSKIGSQR